MTDTLIHTDPATLPAPVADLLARGDLYAGLDFWQAVTRSYAAIVANAGDADTVVAILKANPHTERELGYTLREGHGFWHTGGDLRFAAALRDNGGWSLIWSQSSLFYVVRNDANGDLLTYCEGDVSTGIAYGAPAHLATVTA